jgi:cellulose synthase A
MHITGMSKSSDLSSPYGYRSVAWKDRVDSWKSRQEKLQMTTAEGVTASSGSKTGSVEDNGVDGADASMYEVSYFYIFVMFVIQFL